MENLAASLLITRPKSPCVCIRYCCPFIMFVPGNPAELGSAPVLVFTFFFMDLEISY
jgi:hypothetical protein